MSGGGAGGAGGHEYVEECARVSHSLICASPPEPSPCLNYIIPLDLKAAP